MNVVELFSGIGAQAKALERSNIDHDILATCDWDINAIIAYDLIHNGPQNDNYYVDMMDDELNDLVMNLNISSNGKVPMSSHSKLALSRITKEKLLFAIDRTHNLIDITRIHGENLPENIDLLTYSFPCQDLSLAGSWHNNQGGIDRNANNRSSLLWQVERILNERLEQHLPMPRALLMENVTAITSEKHRNNFNEWKNNLRLFGYINRVYTLDARMSGIPQKRKRTFMISFFIGDNELTRGIVENEFERVNENNIFDWYPRNNLNLFQLLRTDYTNNVYFQEALDSNPNDTLSRREIYQNNIHINNDTLAIPTITTKQDRHPNSGVINFNSNREGKSTFRYLTPRECFLLMGFDEQDYDAIMNGNFISNKRFYFFTRDKLNKMAGNSICVNVLESIFEFINNVLELLD